MFMWSAGALSRLALQLFPPPHKKGDAYRPKELSGSLTSGRGSPFCHVMLRSGSVRSGIAEADVMMAGGVLCQGKLQEEFE